MKLSSMISLFLSLSLLLNIHSEVIPEERNVLVLKDGTFDQALKNHTHILVMFYAPWCNHCTEIMPIYEKAAEKLKPEKLFLAKVDGTTEKKLAEKFNLNGFPTIKLFVSGKENDYVGGRKEEDFLNFMRRRCGPAYVELKNKDDLERFKKENEVAIVYFGKNQDKIKVFSSVSNQNVDYAFGVVGKKELWTEVGAGENSVILYKHFDEKEDRLQDFDETKLKDFVVKNAFAKVLKFDDKIADLVFVKKNPAMILFASDKSNQWETYGNMLRNIAPKIGDKLRLILTDISHEGLEANLGQYMGVREKDLPALRLADSRTEHLKYKFDGKINEANILNFVKDWESNKLKRYYKSAEPPKENNGDVFIVTGNTFEKEVINNEKDVMLFFYAPWCSHCQALKPNYEEAARLLKRNKDLIMAKIDTTENEVESVELEGLPTVKFYPGKKKNETALDYYGDRTTPDIIKFIKKKASNKIITEEDEKINGEL